MMGPEAQRASYDGMNEASAALWRRFLELYEDRFEAFYYNVRVGAGVRPPAGYSPEMIRDWWATTALRIDVVAEREGETWVMEVAERPSTKILGNLQLYTHLLPLYQGQGAERMDVIEARHAQDFLLPTMVRARVVAALICRFLGADMAEVVRKAGILCFVFPGAGYPKLPPTFLPSTLGPGWAPA
jgi:hypothetical protein